MESNKLPEEISRLVDHLRSNKEQEFSLTDIASVTEVLVSTMVSYFSSVDASIYNECRSLTDYIKGAREEIAALSPSDDGDSHIPRAGKELDAIVKATEEATDSIMNAAEVVMDALGGDDLESKRAEIEAASMEIFEACSFQDITGQRISKVVETFNHIEQRIAELGDLMGVTSGDILAAQGNKPVKEKHDPLARGPSLEGEGIEQDAVDALLNDGGFDAAPAPAAETPAAKPAPATKPAAEKPKEEKPKEKAAPAPAPAKAAEKPKSAPPAPKVEDDEEEGIDQAAIDALFD
ncbi:MAG: protein phosphatase CheZ [Sphingomonadales bacterium]|nr:protein phosphatase CheZ [Sphingomonadales bacterium]